MQIHNCDRRVPGLGAWGRSLGHRERRWVGNPRLSYGDAGRDADRHRDGISKPHLAGTGTENSAESPAHWSPREDGGTRLVHVGASSRRLSICGLPISRSSHIPPLLPRPPSSPSSHLENSSASSGKPIPKKRHNAAQSTMLGYSGPCGAGTALQSAGPTAWSQPGFALGRVDFPSSCCTKTLKGCLSVSTATVPRLAQLSSRPGSPGTLHSRPPPRGTRETSRRAAHHQRHFTRVRRRKKKTSTHKSPVGQATVLTSK